MDDDRDDDTFDDNHLDTYHSIKSALHRWTIHTPLSLSNSEVKMLKTCVVVIVATSSLVLLYLTRLSRVWSPFFAIKHYHAVAEKLTFERCALVSNGGTMLHAKFSQIEHNYDAIVRMNLAPVKGFEGAVGKRTTVRSFPNSEIPLVSHEFPYQQEDIRFTRSIGHRNQEALNNATARNKRLQIYVFEDPTPQIERLKGHYTTGFWTIAALRYFCESVFLIGFNEKDNLTDDLRYQYWIKHVMYTSWAENLLAKSKQGEPGHDFDFEHSLYANISAQRGTTGRALIEEVSWQKFDEVAFSNPPTTLVETMPFSEMYPRAQ